MLAYAICVVRMRYSRSEAEKALTGKTYTSKTSLHVHASELLRHSDVFGLVRSDRRTVSRRWSRRQQEIIADILLL